MFKESSSSNKVYFIENYSGEHGAATNIFMQEITDGKVATIFAKSGFITTKPDGERVVVLEHGQRYVGEPGSANYEVAEFQRYTAGIGESQQMPGPSGNRQAIPTAQLLSQDSADYRAELAWRLSMPISCVILALLAIPMSYFNPRSGQTYNLLLALLVFFVYQNGLTVARNWVAQGKAGVWLVLLVHLAILALALALLSYRNRPARPIGQALSLLFRKS